ncbi:hypothetical protein [Candidatus Neomicrothrix sp.]|uniref:hypothetical protein n=1 Tax=Candidatus Neomicrothrix sp. TaxID=2719034 RepID=UPI0025969391|nr:hypothetical protein [Candidatus Microthrix sp.]HMS48707.1 hypothetical protein [Candidatus Microthrix sp.]
MTSPLEAAENAALGRIDRAKSLLLMLVPLGDGSDPLTRIDVAGRCEGFRGEVMSAAGEAEAIGACRLATQDAEALASEITGAAP